MPSFSLNMEVAEEPGTKEKNDVVRAGLVLSYQGPALPRVTGRSGARLQSLLTPGPLSSAYKDISKNHLRAFHF